MRDDLGVQALVALVRAVTDRGDPSAETAEPSLDDLFEDARALAGGTEREARRALGHAQCVLRVLLQHADLVASLSRGSARRLVARECGRWEELVDSTRARLADGRPVVIYSSRRNGRRSRVA